MDLIMDLNKNTELRHIPINIRETLAQILENSWEILMEGIPKRLAENNDVDFDDRSLKYSSDQINLVHKHCMVQKINFPALVVFDEWGSSGKIRPTLGHLVKILSKLQLYRAADYLCNLLNEPCPIRPADGPAARIAIESFEDEMPTQTSSTTYGDNRNIPDNDNKGYSNENKVQLPVKSASSVSDLIKLQSLIEHCHIESRTTNPVSSTHSKPIQEEDISKIPQETLPSVILPDLSFIGNTENNGNSGTFITPKFSELIEPSISGPASIPTIINNENESTSFRPNFSELMEQSNDSALVPNLSVFDMSTSHNTNYSIRTNGYEEIENIQFSDIQAATENFHVRRKLGEGGFSTVYLAINLRAAFKLSAIKRLHTNYTKSEYFFREIELLKNIEHENLIKLLGYSSHQDEMCFVYEYIKGGNLYEKLENCRLDNDQLHWKERINIARGCSEGIKYLHSSSVNIIHRDIKSSNILLDGTTPKICDFGFVKNANFNTATNAVGTNPYMAPETVRGNVSIAVDIFAFGVVILELVSGFNVLDNSKPNEVIDLVTHFESSLKQSDYHIAFTDKKAGDWKHLNYTKTAAEELLELARKCLLTKSDRLEILDVNLGLTKIYTDYCTS